ncbi:MAG: glycosyltransferase, partial [Deltaproteobacteria bacterium]|nr:glycosyltransferase [Deltaproteobacteria bacterium]
MHIGVLTTSYPRAPADLAGRFVAELDAWLASRGCVVEVLAPAPALNEDPSVVVHGLSYARSPRLFAGSGAPDALLGGDRLSRAAAWAQVPAFVTKLAVSCHARARGWQGLISHWLVPCGVVAAQAGRGLPHLAIAHATDVHLIERLPLPMARAALALLCRSRTQLVLTREGLREPLLRCARRKTWGMIEAAKVQRMGIHMPLVTSPGSECGLSTKKTQLLFLGRLVEVKGVHRLLEALRGLDVELVIAGDGPERGRLEARARQLNLDAH